MQLPLRTQSSPEAYIAGREWRHARLPACPLHPSGGCSFARHGSYARVTPQGIRIPRWYCPEGHRTFSLLPDFLAARLPGLLSSVDVAIADVKSARSMEAAADRLRGFEVTLPSALRWLRRRVQAVQAGLEAWLQLVPQAPMASSVSDGALHPETGRTHDLCGLRQTLPAQLLQKLPAPLGFLAWRRADRGRDADQHDMGPDGEVSHSYTGNLDVSQSPCNTRPPIPCQQTPFRRPRTCSESGTTIVACGTAVPACTCNGSGDSEPTARATSSTSGPS